MYSNTRSDSWMGKTLIFIVVVIMILTATSFNGLTNAPKRAAEAAGIQVDVDRKAAVLAAEAPGLPALAAAQQAWELEQIVLRRAQDARDAEVYRQAQDEQLRKERAQNDQEIARGEQNLALRQKAGDLAVYVGVFAAVMLVLIVAYTVKRTVDRMLPPPAALPVDVRSPLQPEQPRRTVIIEGQATDVDSRATAGRQAPRFSGRGAGPHVENGRAGNGYPAHATNHNGFIGIPTGQPKRERRQTSDR